MLIEELINKYFEGDTSAAEEKQLREYFSSADVAPEWIAYKPLFAYFNEEIEKEHKEGIAVNKHVSLPQRAFYIISGIAATVLILLSINYWVNPSSTRFCAENYVIINGQCYTDIHKIREMAFDALQEVAPDEESFLPDIRKDFFGQEIMENQLKELGSMFSDEN